MSLLLRGCHWIEYRILLKICLYLAVVIARLIVLLAFCCFAGYGAILMVAEHCCILAGYGAMLMVGEDCYVLAGMVSC